MKIQALLHQGFRLSFDPEAIYEDAFLSGAIEFLDAFVSCMFRDSPDGEETSSED